MAKKVVEELKALEVELVAKVKSAFHTIFTEHGKVEFTDGKAVVPAENKDLIEAVQATGAIESVTPVQQAPVAEAPQEDAK